MHLSVQVALYVTYRKIKDKSNQFTEGGVLFCGASLVAPSWLLTTGFCMNQIISIHSIPNPFSKKAFVRAEFGAHDCKYSRCSNRVSRLVRYFVPHPDYQFGKHPYDVALLKLDEPVQFDSTISPICIPDRTFSLSDDYKCYAAGWDVNAANADPMNFTIPYSLRQSHTFFSGHHRHPWLLEVELPYVSQTRCREKYWSMADWLHVCAGEEGKGTYKTDRGGSLFCQNPKDGRWYIFGISSLGFPPFNIRHYSVYTCIRGVSHWIRDLIQSTNYIESNKNPSYSIII